MLKNFFSSQNSIICGIILIILFFGLFLVFLPRFIHGSFRFRDEDFGNNLLIQTPKCQKYYQKYGNCNSFKKSVDEEGLNAIAQHNSDEASFVENCVSVCEAEDPPVSVQPQPSPAQNNSPPPPPVAPTPPPSPPPQTYYNEGDVYDQQGDANGQQDNNVDEYVEEDNSSDAGQSDVVDGFEGFSNYYYL